MSKCFSKNGSQADKLTPELVLNLGFYEVKFTVTLTWEGCSSISCEICCLRIPLRSYINIVPVSSPMHTIPVNIKMSVLINKTRKHLWNKYNSNKFKKCKPIFRFRIGWVPYSNNKNINTKGDICQTLCTRAKCWQEYMKNWIKYTWSEMTADKWFHIKRL